MEWNMEENFSMESNMERKIFCMEWKWNGKKLPEWNMEKSSFIPFHAMPCRKKPRDNLFKQPPKFCYMCVQVSYLEVKK